MHHLSDSIGGVDGKGIISTINVTTNAMRTLGLGFHATSHLLQRGLANPHVAQ